MKTVAYILAGVLALGSGVAVSTAPARADEPVGYSHRTYKGRPVLRYGAVSRPRRIVREVVVERPVIYRPRPLVREVFVEAFDDGPPPYAYGPPLRPRFAYGPGFFRPIRPVGFGFGPRFGYGPYF